MRMLHQSTAIGSSGQPRTSLEQFDTFGKVTALIMRTQDVSEWTSDDVEVWLKAHAQFEPYASKFNSNEIDGYSLLNLTESDMVETLGMHDANLRAQLKRAVKKLIVVWIRYGKNCEAFFREEADSLFFDEQSLIDQSGLNQTDGNVSRFGENFSIVKMLGAQGNMNANQSLSMSMSMVISPTAQDMMDDSRVIDEVEKSRLLQSTPQGQAIVSKADHLAALLDQEKEDGLNNHHDQSLIVDPTEDMYIKTLSSFKFLINFEELEFSKKRDLIQKACPQSHWCSLYQANWLGMKVSLRKFSAKNTLHSHKQITNFLKELEVAHSLRHPNIVLYMGLSLDPIKSNAFIVHEFVSKASLFDIIHGVRPRKRIIQSGKMLQQQNKVATISQDQLKSNRSDSRFEPTLDHHKLQDNNTGENSSHRSEASTIFEEAAERQGGVGALPEDIIFRVAKQLANALCYLHRQKILHCNLKSKSILVCSNQGSSSVLNNMQRSIIVGPDGQTPLQSLLYQDWRVKIADFTLSKHSSVQGEAISNLQEQELSHQQSQGFGERYDLELNWSAPETLRDEAHSEASDVFSFGMILLEMLTGEVPHAGRSPAQITGTVGYFAEKLKAPSKAGKEMRHLVNNCLLFEAERRPNFQDIVKHLDKVEQQPREEQKNPYIGNLKDFLS